MKKLIYALSPLMAILTSVTLQAQDVNIPDASFKAVLVANTGININNDGEIQASEAAAFTGAIDVSSKDIVDLTGIEAFTAVSQLNCSYNSLTTLDISSNAALYNLDCQYNKLTDLTLNNYLSYLICNNNQLASLDVSSSHYMSTLICNDNKLTSLNVSSNPGMFQLACTNNLLTGIDISSCTGLHLLYCNDNQLAALDLSANNNLFALYCSNNQLTSLEVASNTALGIITCQNNELTGIEVSNNPALFVLDVQGNNITGFDLSGNTALENLNCGYNQLTAIDVSTNTNLKYLSCFYNQLDELDITTNTKLEILSCEGNQLTSLDLSANPLLYDFGCTYNQLTGLDVSHNTALLTLFCGNNQLTSLDVSANTALIQLYCADNQLSSLNMKNGNNANMNYFYSWNNPSLSCIQVDDAAYMEEHWANNKDETSSFSNSCCPTYFASLRIASGSSSSICAGSSTSLSVNITNAYASNTYFDIHYTEGASAVTRRIFVSGSNVNAVFSITPSVSTNYKLTSITDANGCAGLIGPAASDTFELVTVSVPPVIAAEPSLTSDLCPGTPVKLTSTKAASYAWSNGRTTRSVIVAKAGSYTVTTNSASGCQGTSQPVEITYRLCGLPTGISITSVTGNSAAISFTGPSCGQGYELRYKIRNTTGWTKIMGITGSPYTLGGLSPNTPYSLQIRTVCSTNPVRYSDWTSTYGFKTAAAFTGGTIAVQTDARTTNRILQASLSPNPATGNTIVSISGALHPVSLVVTDMAVKTLLRVQNIGAGQYRLALDGLAAGIYLVHLDDGENKQTLKLVKQ